MGAGMEMLCRLGLVAPKAIHKAGFHPTAVLGSLAASFAVGVAQGLDAKALADTLGIAGSTASGIIEYLGDGSWTKRMHAGWAAQSGLRAAAMGRAGFVGPAQVLEGEHGFFKAFAPSISRCYEKLFDGLGDALDGRDHHLQALSLRHHGAALYRLRAQAQAEGVRRRDRAIHCLTADGYVHRLWEPLELKRNPPTRLRARSSASPSASRSGSCAAQAGLADFSDEAIADGRCWR